MSGKREESQEERRLSGQRTSQSGEKSQSRTEDSGRAALPRRRERRAWRRRRRDSERETQGEGKRGGGLSADKGRKERQKEGARRRRDWHSSRWQHSGRITGRCWQGQSRSWPSWRLSVYPVCRAQYPRFQGREKSRL